VPILATRTSFSLSNKKADHPRGGGGPSLTKQAGAAFMVAKRVPTAVGPFVSHSQPYSAGVATAILASASAASGCPSWLAAKQAAIQPHRPWSGLVFVHSGTKGAPGSAAAEPAPLLHPPGICTTRFSLAAVFTLDMAESGISHTRHWCQSVAWCSF
jgi:hypothetical protein